VTVVRDTPTDLTVWRNFRVALPATWEMLQFSRKMDAGRCSFADRYRVRFEMNWRRVPGAPDDERMLSDYRARLEGQGVEDLVQVEQAGWTGLAGREDIGLVSRFGRFFAAESCLVEAVFIWPDERDAKMERTVLASVAEEPAVDGARRWRVFGMDLAVPAGVELVECRRHAARAELVFRAERGVNDYRFMRLGMVKAWLNSPVDRWLASHVPPGVRIEEAKERTVKGHSVAQLTGRAKRWFRGLRIRRPTFEARAGICPADGRLYFVSRMSSVPGSELSLPCCAGVPPRSPGEAGEIRLAQQDKEGSWIDMLAARPRRNEAVRVERRDDGSVAITVKRSPEKDLRPPLSWIVPVQREKQTRLDELGRLVWDLCDGNRTVEQVVDVFAGQHDLTFHEGRVSVTEYLKELIRRGILAVEMEEAE